MEMWVRSSTSFKRPSEDSGIEKGVKLLKLSSRKNFYSESFKIHTGFGKHDKEFPMFIALANLSVTNTGFTDSNVRADIIRKVQIMCGEHTDRFNRRTTHVIAAHANTAKVQAARKRDVPVVSIDWLENLYKACQNNNPYLHASFPEFKEINIPLFYNLKFNFSTRLEKATRKLYEDLVVEHGGKVSSGLSNSPAYFYICEKPEVSVSYLFTINRAIVCVTPLWIKDTVAAQNFGFFADYRVTGDPTKRDPAGFDVDSEDEDEDGMRNDEDMDDDPDPEVQDSGLDAETEEEDWEINNAPDEAEENQVVAEPSNVADGDDSDSSDSEDEFRIIEFVDEDEEASNDRSAAG